jgi:hypothetical protein
MRGYLAILLLNSAQVSASSGTCLTTTVADQEWGAAAPLNVFDDKPSCCTKCSETKLKPNLDAYEFHFEKCGSCRDNWNAVLASANCDAEHSRFITQRRVSNGNASSTAGSSCARKAANFTLTLHPALCSKLWYSCESEDTDAFNVKFPPYTKGPKKRISSIFQNMDAAQFSAFTAAGWSDSDVGNATSGVFNSLGTSFKSFGAAFLPSTLAESLMPQGAESFCAAMGLEGTGLGLTIGLHLPDRADKSGCVEYPLHVAVGLADCTDCLTVDMLKQAAMPKGELVSRFRGYEFCYSEELDHSALQDMAAERMSFLLFLLVGGTGANIVFQSNREGVYACQWISESLLYLLAGTLLGCVALANNADPDALSFQPTTFMFLLLPPIMLREGFCINRRLFFANLNTIVLLAFLGTFITVFIIASMILWVQSLASDSYPWPALTTNEAFLYATVISAVDPVAVVSQFAALGVDPGVEILVVGESLVNDAVIIVLFKIWKEAVLKEQSAEEFDYVDILVSELTAPRVEQLVQIYTVTDFCLPIYALGSQPPG